MVEVADLATRHSDEGAQDDQEEEEEEEEEEDEEDEVQLVTSAARGSKGSLDQSPQCVLPTSEGVNTLEFRNNIAASSETSSLRETSQPDLDPKVAGSKLQRDQVEHLCSEGGILTQGRLSTTTAAKFSKFYEVTLDPLW